MADRSYLSIGEVLTLLRDEFPDITISKIRFLESQGLLDPERTPSGYRKFYEGDVDRLRWILRQQREHFLPLKVIRGRLLGEPGDDTEDGATLELDHHLSVQPEVSEAESALTASKAGASRAGTSRAGTSRAGPSKVGAGPADAQARPEGAARRPGDTALSPGMSGVSLTLEELASATGLSMERLRELEKAGFVAGRAVAGSVYYDEEALVVGKLAVSFARFGIETRHLRTYKNAAEREAGLFEQVVTPLLKQRNPKARKEAMDALEELTGLGEGLRAAMLRQAIKGIIGG